MARLAAILYLASAIALVYVWKRFIQPVSAAAAVVLVLLPFCFTGRALLTGRVYAPIDLPYMAEPLKDYAKDAGIERIHNGTLSDLYAQIIPWRAAVRHALAQREWPVWNPFLLSGSILAANMQAAPYDPVNLLGLLLSHADALTYGAAMTFFLAAFFTFAFARALGCSEPAALVAAGAYAFNGVLAFFVGWPLGRAWVFLPLVLFAIRARRPALLTVALVLTIFAGHPETTLHVVAVGVAYGVFDVGRALARRDGLKTVLRFALSGLLAIGITAIAMLPFLSAAPHTSEYDLRRNVYAPADFYTTAEHVANRAARTFFPWFGGQPERDNITPLWDPSAGRVGSIVVALAIAAVIFVRRKETWFFAGLALVTLCAAFDAPPIAHLLHELPLFDIALNQRLAFAAAFALAILAALAIDAWPKRAAAGVCLAVAIAMALVTRVLWDGQVKAGVDPDLIRALTAVELAPLVVVALLLVFRTPARFALPLVLGLVLLQRAFADGTIYPTLHKNVFYPEIPILREMQKPGQPFRIAGLNYTLIPDTAALYGLEDVRGYEAMTFERLAATFSLWSTPQPVSFNVITDLSKPFLSFLNVRYAIVTINDPAPDGWRLVLQDRNSRLLENTRALPRAFIPRRVRYEKSSVPILLGMGQATDFSDLAWITVPHYPPHEIANGPGQLSLNRDGFTYEIDALMDRDGWVVVSDSKWPGWRAYLDGKRVETHYANHAFIGVFVPQGTHRVTLTYVPEAFTRGRNLTLATLAAIALWYALRHRLQKPRAV